MKFRTVNLREFALIFLVWVWCLRFVLSSVLCPLSSVLCPLSAESDRQFSLMLSFASSGGFASLGGFSTAVFVHDSLGLVLIALAFA